MRLLLLTEYFAPHSGGTAVYYYEVWRRLRGVDATVVTREHPSAAAFDRNQPFAIVRTPFLPVPKVRMVIETAVHFLIGLRLIAGRSFEVVHGGQVYPLGLAAFGIGLLTRVPYILYVHGEEVATARRRPWTRAVAAFLLRRASAVFVNSWFSAGLVAALGVPESRIHVAPPGVDPRRFRPTVGSALRTRLGAEGRRVLLSVGRLIPRKGQDTVIRLLPRIAAAVPDVVYWIAGDGVEAERRRLRDLAAAYGVVDRVKFIGEIAEEELPALYAACDVFVMLNRTMPDGDVEGFGIVFLEASACGKPVVGGRSGGAIEAVGDGKTGLLVPENDDDAAVGAIVRLLCDPALRARLGGSGRRWAIRHFSWDRTARRVRRVTAAVARRPQTRAQVRLEKTEVPA